MLRDNITANRMEESSATYAKNEMLSDIMRDNGEWKELYVSRELQI